MTGAQTSPFITFFIGEDRFAAHAADVSEVFRIPRITRVPGGPDSLLGIAGLRGVASPVVSLARLLGREDQLGDDSRLLLLEGRQNIGLTVDRVGALANLPTPGDGAPRDFGRLFAFENSALRVLDLDGLLRTAFARGLGEQKSRAEPIDTEVTVASTEVALLSFELAGQAYALPLEEVSEVLSLPDRLTSIAQSEATALGVINLRDRLLPVVSLRALLGLGGAVQANARIVVTTIGDAVVGLVVDRLNAIVRVNQDAIDAAPAVLNRGTGEAQVQSICRLPGGRGLVAVLSAERMFRDEKVTQILADGRSETSQMSKDRHEDGGWRYLILRIGAEEYGLPLAFVEEVVRLPERLTRVPKAPAFIEGVLNLRGRVTPVIDQRSRFGADFAGAAARPRVVVTTVDGRQAGFIVDSVTEILSLSEAQLEETPALAADAGRLFNRIATLDGGERLILLIEPKEMLDRAERDLLARLDTAENATQP